MTPAVVELDKVTFCRKKRMILSDVSWRIEAGKHWALLGANGSGKTTLLKILTGYEWPTFGTVRVLGERFGICDIGRLRKLIGWVSSAMTQRLPMQDLAVEVVASGLDASIGLYRQISPEEFAKSLDMLKKLRADSIAHQDYGTLSQGEMQKVLIARALVCEPKLLILDEPCIGLDPAARQRFMNDLAVLARQDNAPTIILVTHHIEEIDPWIQQVLLLKNGQVLAVGEPDDVITSRRMSELFDYPCSVFRQGAEFLLRIDN
ncbi:MAG TPA: ABC transporter ATP-binding protein [Anaerohalosphaeraceae bacterium]|nr:ABC transporter ATP-binding protein [Anaerohalosphaeraceae bacterium]HOL31627.1 ABC transporter ATP-binding protein [Anaerohalosphaeraceae bacterium]HOM75911.1 ABC transporter ATP-binding protein [Anaerohalosphaeraceae bacterium]HPC63718.1 ABC transporter ATP-binding protein [Anaerohalosphaeraceae bacterium]HPO69020.1 ABC transporter ATP-binding protein [Anaerohalosphaeraceae bacterium]